MDGLAFALAIILLAICYLISYAFSSNGTKSHPKIKPMSSFHSQPVVVVIGATSTRGQQVLNLLKDKPVTCIAVSRRENRWLKLKDQFPKVAWYRGDLRLSSEMDYLFEQIKQHYGAIDMIINLTYLSGSINNFGKISSIRVKDNVFCKLPRAYDAELIPHSHSLGSAGEESPLFTNIIGLIVLKNLSIKYHVNNVIMILGDDSVVNELIHSIERYDSGVVNFASIKPNLVDAKLTELIDSILIK